MPITVADLQNKRRTITVETIAGDVEITYRLGEVTEAALDEHNTPGFGGIIALLAQWIERWDVLDGEEMLPITVETLKSLPRSFLLDIYGAINGDTRLRPTKRRGSLSAS